MKIGIDCRLWNETGVGRYARNLVYHLQKFDNENEYVLFVLPKDKNDIKIQNLNFKTVEVDIRWHSLKEQLLFPFILKKERLDLVHFPYFSIPILYRGKFVITIHDLILFHHATGKASTLSPFFYRIKLLAYKLVISRAVKKSNKNYCGNFRSKGRLSENLENSSS